MFIKIKFTSDITILELARLCGVAPCSILAANGCGEDDLVGRIITVPVSTPHMARQAGRLFYKTDGSELLEEITEKFYIPRIYAEAVAGDTTQKGLQSGRILMIEKPGLTEHIVKPMQTLDSIAALYNKTADEIKVFNNIQVCWLGQKIYIP